MHQIIQTASFEFIQFHQFNENYKDSYLISNMGESLWKFKITNITQ